MHFWHILKKKPWKLMIKIWYTKHIVEMSFSSFLCFFARYEFNGYTLSQVFASTSFRYFESHKLFLLKLRSFTNIKNVQIICIWNAPLLLQASINNPKYYRKYTGIKHCISHEIVWMIKLKNCARYSEWVPNGIRREHFLL